MTRVMISGTSRGLGLAIARDLAADHEVVGFARGAIAAPEGGAPDGPEGGAEFRHRSGIDLGDPASLETLVPELATCDGLVNNVAAAGDGVFVLQSPASIAGILQVNLAGTIRLTQLYLRERLAARRPGTVVTVASIAAIRGLPGLAVYSATKGALTALTRSLAREMGGKGFRFNAVLPGYIDTEMSGGLTPARWRQILRRTPLGRLGRVEDVVPAVRFLLSDAAGFISGTCLVVDGGLTC